MKTVHTIEILRNTIRHDRFVLQLEQLSLIEDWGQTDRVTALPRPCAGHLPLTLTYDLDFLSQVSCGRDPLAQNSGSEVTRLKW